MIRTPILLLLATACMPAPAVREIRTSTCPAVQDAVARGVRWVSPGHEGSRDVNDAWCRATAGVVLEQASQPAPPADTVRLLSWNVNAGGGQLARVLTEELGVPCDGLNLPTRPVIALLQEAYRADEDFPGRGEGRRAQRPAPEGRHRPDREDVVAVALRCGLALFYVPAVRNGWGRAEGGYEDRGNAVLSSLTITAPAVVALTPESARRLVVVADVTIGAATLRLATTHFTTLPLPWRMLARGNSSRVLQAETLVNGMNLLPVPGRPTLLAGDFNAWSMAEGGLKVLADAFPESPPALEDTRGPYPTDHVFFRAGSGGVRVVPGSYRVLPGTHGSDHRPIRLDVVVER